mgnify:CR=1 FL=1
MTQTKLIKKFYLEFEGENTKETILIDSSSSSIKVVQYDEDRATLNDFDDVNDDPDIDF